MEVYQGLGLDDGDLVRVGVERVEVELISSGLEVDVAERLQTADGQIRKTDEDAAIACETLKIDVALAVEVGAHLFDLEIGHVAHSAAERAFVVSLTVKAETFDEAPLRQTLAGHADEFREAKVFGENAYDVRTAGDPDDGFVLLRLKVSLGEDVEKLWVKGPLVQGKTQFADRQVSSR